MAKQSLEIHNQIELERQAKRKTLSEFACWSCRQAYAENQVQCPHCHVPYPPYVLDAAAKLGHTPTDVDMQHSQTYYQTLGGSR